MPLVKIGSCDHRQGIWEVGCEWSSELSRLSKRVRYCCYFWGKNNMQAIERMTVFADDDVEVMRDGAGVIETRSLPNHVGDGSETDLGIHG